MSANASPDHRKNATNALVLSILGAVCGGLLTNALNGSPTLRLMGTVLGAAIPQLITQVGPGHRLRASLAIGVTGLGLFAAYGGFAVFAFASDRPSVVPLPSIVPEPGGGGGGGEKPSSPGMDVSTHSVDCGAQTVAVDCKTVTVTSTGGTPLTVYRVQLNPQKTGLSQNQNCVKESPLPKNETCWVRVMFAPDDSPGIRSANLSIHARNVKTESVAVRGEVAGANPVGDLAIAPEGITCEYLPDATIDGETTSALVLTFTVSFDGSPAELAPTETDVSASIDESTTPPGTRPEFPIGEASSLPLPIEDQYDVPSVAFTLHVDPDNSVSEVDETNNELDMKFATPEPSQASGSIQCDATS